MGFAAAPMVQDPAPAARRHDLQPRRGGRFATPDMARAGPARDRSSRQVECSRRARLPAAGWLAPMLGPAAASRPPRVATSRQPAAVADPRRRRLPRWAPKSSRSAPDKCADSPPSVSDRTAKVARAVSSRGGAGAGACVGVLRACCAPL